MYVITGATGNIGSKMAVRFINMGKPVRLIGRNEGKLNKMATKTAESAIGTLEDVEFLAKSFKDATAVFAMIPPLMNAEDVRGSQNKIGTNLTEAIKSRR